MAVDNTNETTGAPEFQSSGGMDTAADLTTLGEFAAKVGTRLIGTTSERTGYDYAREGLAWYDTDLDTEYVYDGSGWVAGWQDSGWANLTLSTGWTAVAGHTPRARRVGDIVYIEGAALRGSGGALDDIATVADHAPAKTMFYGASTALKSGTGRAASELYISSAGVISVFSYTDIDSSTGWAVPLSGSYLLG